MFDTPAELAILAVALGWVGIVLILIVGNHAAAKGGRRRDRRSRLGLLLQCVAYALCFCFRRALFSPLVPSSRPGEQVVAALTIALTAVSVWFCWTAARALGKQWALEARIIDGHELIVTGPFGVVRNPVYLAMLGVVVATGLAVTRWPFLVLAVLAYLAGTAIRIRSEERLLREAFGHRFDQYARRVPALVPNRWL